MQLKDVKKSINSVLDNAFDAEVIAYRIEEDIPRPSFKVHLSDLRSTPGRSNTVDKNVIVRLYYFCTDPEDCDIEQMEIRDKLSNLFSSIVEVGEEVIRFKDYEDDVTGGTVQVSFEVEYSSLISKEAEYPNMDNLVLEMEEGA